MSRIGRAPIPLPDGVTVTIEGQTVSVAGPKGNLRHVVVEPIRVLQDDGVLRVATFNVLHGRSPAARRCRSEWPWARDADRSRCRSRRRS